MNHVHSPHCRPGHTLCTWWPVQTPVSASPWSHTGRHMQGLCWCRQRCMRTGSSYSSGVSAATPICQLPADTVSHPSSGLCQAPCQHTAGCRSHPQARNTFHHADSQPAHARHVLPVVHAASHPTGCCSPLYGACDNECWVVEHSNNLQHSSIAAHQKNTLSVTTHAQLAQRSQYPIRPIAVCMCLSA